MSPNKLFLQMARPLKNNLLHLQRIHSSELSGNLMLTKDSAPEQMKNYFSKILKLSQTGKVFPIDLNDVWPLLYKQKVKALAVLRSDFIEGEDYQLSQTGKVVNSNNLKNGVKIDARLSVPCMEYFIAKKVRPVFEVYRQVFHKAANEGQRAIDSEAGYNENELFRTRLGNYGVWGYYTGGSLYFGLGTIMRFLGYNSGGSGKQYAKRIGLDKCIKVDVSKQPQWFVNMAGVDELLKFTTYDVPYDKEAAVYRDLFRVHKNKGGNKEGFEYKYSASQMNGILFALNSSPVRKSKVTELLLKGKGGQS